MNRLTLDRFLIAVALLDVHHVACSQTLTLPQASRSVYKCSVNNKTIYTDEPCVGAQVVNVEPTRGFNKSTGKELTGADVATEKRREQLAEAIRPLTGMNPQQAEVQRRRFNLSAAATAECGTLDGRRAQAEAEERKSTGDARLEIQRDLLMLRQRSRDLRC